MTRFSRFCLVAFLTAILTAPLLARAEPALPLWHQTTPWSTEVAIVRVGDTVVTAEIADTGSLRTRGLGYRDGLGEGRGMLFVFPDDQVRTFWMKGMRFCLDIIWIDGSQVTGAAESVCPPAGNDASPLPTYSSEIAVGWVLEMPAGWLKSIGAGPGTPVEITMPPGYSGSS